MKKSMKNKWVHIFLCIVGASTFAFAGEGYDSGNGGLTLVCMDKYTRYQVNKIQFYDLWYWSPEGLSAEGLVFRKNLKSYPQGTETLIRELAQLVPNYEADLWQEYQILAKKIEYYLRQYELGYHYDYLSRTKDYKDRLAPNHFCSSQKDLPMEVANIARYDKNNSFVLSALYYLALTEVEKNALVFHEVVYRVLEKHQLDHDEAFNTMEITARMMSVQSQDEKLPHMKRIMP